MDVALDNSDSAEDEAAVTSLDITFTPGGGKDMVIIVTHFVSTTGEESISVTYDPGGDDEAAFTALSDNLEAEFVRLRPWILKDSAIVKNTAKTIRVTTDGATDQALGIASFTGVDQEITTENFISIEQQTAQTQPETSMLVDTKRGDMVVGARIVPEVASVWGTKITGMEFSTNSWVNIMTAHRGQDTPIDVWWNYSGTQSYAKYGLNLIQAIRPSDDQNKNSIFFPRLALRRSHAPKGIFELNPLSPQSKHLIGWWPLMEGSGEAPRDFSTFNNHTAYSSNDVSDWSYANHPGQTRAFNFSGATDEGLIIGDLPQFGDGIDEFCVSCWCYLNATFANWQNLVGKWHDSASRSFTLALSGTSINDALTGFTDDDSAGTEDSQSNSNLASFIGRWRFVAFQWTSGTERELYVDGVEDTFSESAVGDGSLIVNDQRMMIGRHESGITSPFNGRIRDVRFYDKFNTSPDLIREMYLNPWDLFLEPKRVFYSFPGASEPTRPILTMPLRARYGY